MMARNLLILLFILAISACDNGDDPRPTDLGRDTLSADLGGVDAAQSDGGVDLGPTLGATERGTYGVGVVTLRLDDTARARTLDVEVWYPADAMDGAADVLDFEDEPNRSIYRDLLAAAPDCPSRTTNATRDASAADGRWPVIAFSHCHSCMRYSSFSVAEHLASWGYVVIAPDHEDNTLFDELRDEGASVSQEFLAVRAADIEFVLDRLLRPDAAELPADLRGELDSERVGMMGHSFGSVTAGLVAQNDDRIKAALGFAAPMENPLLPGVTVADIAKPLMFVVAMEDNSIREIGNRLIRDNFTKVAAEAWKVEVADAGHWSFSDIAGLTDAFAAGCGDGNRQTATETFTYIGNETARGIASAYALAFFQATLRSDASARRFLEGAAPWPEVTVEERN